MVTRYHLKSCNHFPKKIIRPYAWVTLKTKFSDPLYIGDELKTLVKLTDSVSYKAEVISPLMNILQSTDKGHQIPLNFIRDMNSLLPLSESGCSVTNGSTLRKGRNANTCAFGSIIMVVPKSHTSKEGNTVKMTNLFDVLNTLEGDLIAHDVPSELNNNTQRAGHGKFTAHVNVDGSVGRGYG
ncbi:hypothetical protein Tco_0827552 [Tanacetum coccineum]